MLGGDHAILIKLILEGEGQREEKKEPENEKTGRNTGKKRGRRGSWSWQHDSYPLLFSPQALERHWAVFPRFLDDGTDETA
eukprot:1391647-Amorphochlora_amoeboformis.AAC.1